MAHHWSPFRGSLLVLLALSQVGCDKKAEEHHEPRAAANDSPRAPTLPPLELRDDTEGLLLTYVDDAARLQVKRKISEVPAAFRGEVRVVVRGKPAGSKDAVYVANLNEKSPGGNYPVRVIPRAEWDARGSEARRAQIAELMPEPIPPGEAGPVSAIVYGADWCKPCHAAEDYMKAQGIEVEKKDIEKSETARAELNRKLTHANMSGASIPVIDVSGTLLVGFSPAALDRAIAQARQRAAQAKPAGPVEPKKPAEPVEPATPAGPKKPVEPKKPAGPPGPEQPKPAPQASEPTTTPPAPNLRP